MSSKAKYLNSTSSNENTNTNMTKELKFHRRENVKWLGSQKHKQIEKAVKVQPEDIEVIRYLGMGTFSKVYLWKLSQDTRSSEKQKLYALKIISKQRLDSDELRRYALTERHILTNVKSNFIASLVTSFQTETHLFLLLDYYPGSDLASYLDIEEKFSEEKARFYISECIAAIDCLHK